jgi:hypothetical protein
MIADSLLRILEKRRAQAIELGTFVVGLVPRGTSAAADRDRPSVHDSVLRPLVASARECRVYGVNKNSPLFPLVSGLGSRHQRVWHLDVSRELIRGAEALWNSSCEHNGIVIVSDLSPAAAESVLAACGRPDAWSSRYQLYQGTSRAAVSFCFESVQPGDACSFLFSGSNGIEWMDVFASRQRLAEFWDLAIQVKMKTGLTKPLT